VADIHGIPDPSMMVPVQPMDIQAPMEDLSALAAAAESVANGPRQAQAAALLSGSDAQGVTAGYSGGGGEDWPGSIAS
jgi:hypothetical protein